MKDQLTRLVEANAGKAIVQNDAIANQFNNAAIQEVAGGIFCAMKGQVSQGNMQQVVAMFQGGNKNALANNPMVNQIISSVAQSLASKFGVSPQAASSVVSSLIPTVMNQLVQKTNDPKDSSFDLTDMMRNMSGNNNRDLRSLLGQVAGGSGKQNPLNSIGGVLGGIFAKKR
ncbi:MAG: DUF937 domain-containing protein [Cyclobacteriaceae bacterium]